MRRAIPVVVTTTSLRLSTLGQIRVAFTGVHLAVGLGAHRLILSTKLTGTWLDPDDDKSNAVALLVGSVWTDQPHHRWLVELDSRILTLRGFDVGDELTLSLSDEQLIALERARGEGDIVLQLMLQATLLPPYEDVHPTASDQATLRIPRSRWLELLDQAGTEVGILIRVPSPLVDSSTEAAPAASADDAASLAQATARLRQARAELRDHQWEHCVATCRRVLENIGKLVSIPSLNHLSKVKPEDRTQDDRWAAIYHDVKSMANAAHHDDGTTSQFSWQRADAEAILAATAGLLARYTAGP